MFHGAVDGHRRERLVVGEHHTHRVHDLDHVRVIKGPGGEDRSEACGGKPGVSLAQGHVQSVAQLQNHGAAGIRPTGLQETDVALGNASVQGEVKLGEPAALAPCPE